MTRHAWEPDLVLRARVGLHFGQTRDLKMADKRDIFGRAVDEAARVMSLARGGQVLMTDFVFQPARDKYPDGSVMEQGLPPLRWRDLGQWEMKGIRQPVKLHQAHVEGLELEPPESGDKVYRPEDRPPPKWHPSVGLTIPSSPGWNIEELPGARRAGRRMALYQARQPSRVPFLHGTRPASRPEGLGGRPGRGIIKT
jgi:hypothetical protein